MKLWKAAAVIGAVGLTVASLIVKEKDQGNVFKKKKKEVEKSITLPIVE